MRTGGDHLSNEVAADAPLVNIDSIVDIMMTLAIPSRVIESPRRIESQRPRNCAITLPIRPPSPSTSAHPRWGPRFNRIPDTTPVLSPAVAFYPYSSPVATDTRQGVN